jgi:hypothetical protein
MGTIGIFGWRSWSRASRVRGPWPTHSASATKPSAALFGAGRCGWRGLTKLAKINAGDDSPDFSLRWALKDVNLAVGAAGGCRRAAAIARQW